MERLCCEPTELRGGMVTMKTISRWNNLPMEVVDSTVLNVSNIQLDRVLGPLI